MSGVGLFGQLALGEFLGKAGFNKLTSKAIFRLFSFPNTFELGIFEGFFKMLTERVDSHMVRIISFRIYHFNDLNRSKAIISSFWGVLLVFLLNPCKTTIESLVLVR